MPGDRKFPRFLPRLRKDVGITFGEPIDPSELSAVLSSWREEAVKNSPIPVQAALGTSEFRTKISGEELKPSDYVPLGAESLKKRETRIALTALVRKYVENLGYSIDGPLLGRLPQNRT